MSLVGVFGSWSFQATLDEWEIWPIMNYTDTPISARWTRQSNGLARTVTLFGAILLSLDGWSLRFKQVPILIHCIEDFDSVWNWHIDIPRWLYNQLTRKKMRFWTSQQLYSMAIFGRLVSSIPEYSSCNPLNGLFRYDWSHNLLDITLQSTDSAQTTIQMLHGIYSKSTIGGY